MRRRRDETKRVLELLRRIDFQRGKRGQADALPYSAGMSALPDEPAAALHGWRLRVYTVIFEADTRAGR